MKSAPDVSRETDEMQSAWNVFEAHRHACEVRHVVNLPTRAARAEYLEGVAKHGAKRAERLRADVLRLWEEKKSHD